ncbi:MAG: response regulator [Deltaproteobacteria bacterium]
MGSANHGPVLVVDDDPDIRETIGELLEDEGYRTVRLENGQQALDYLRSEETRPCLVFLDLMMPVMDGQTVLRERAADPNLSAVPVVVITAAGNPSATLPADRILRKPVRLESLLDAVHEFC